MILTKFKHAKINIYMYLIIMKTISIFILLIYWSIMLFAPVMSKDVRISKTKLNKGQTTSVSKVIR
jgi:hypothetical protein